MVTQPLTSPAEAKALAQAEAGRRPVLSEVIRKSGCTTRCYTVPSGSRPDHTWVVEEIGTIDGLSYTCDCPAGMAGRRCWHVAAVELMGAGALPERQSAAKRLGLGRMTADDLWGPRR